MGAVPNYISVEPKPPAVWEARMKKKPKETTAEAPEAALLPGGAQKKDVCGTAKDIEAPTAQDKTVASEAVHCMMPPQAATAAIEGVQDTAADIVVEVQAQAAAVKCEVQKIILQDMIKVLEIAVPAVSKAAKIMGSIIGFTTALELTLNSLIMAFKNIPGLDVYAVDCIAIFASVNAVQKGLLMKLDLDVKRKTVQTAQSQMKALLQTARQESISMEATGEINAAVMSQLKTQFSGIVEKYASFLPH
jgi:hypothetical protein